MYIQQSFRESLIQMAQFRRFKKLNDEFFHPSFEKREKIHAKITEEIYMYNLHINHKH